MPDLSKIIGIERVHNGWIITDRTQSPRLYDDPSRQVATSPYQVAQIVEAWAKAGEAIEPGQASCDLGRELKKDEVIF